METQAIELVAMRKELNETCAPPFSGWTEDFWSGILCRFWVPETGLQHFEVACCAGGAKVREAYEIITVFSKFADMVTLKFHQYQVVGRALPKDAEDTPKIYRMKLWHTNDVRAKSKFWYFLKKVKKSNGQIVAINEVQSGKASDKLLFTYFPFLGFGVLAILHGLLTTSRMSSSMIGTRPVMGRKKKA